MIHGHYTEGPEFHSASYGTVFLCVPDVFKTLMFLCLRGFYGSSRLSASGCMKHSWLNNLEDKAKMYKVRLKSQLRLQRYLAAHHQWKVWNHQSAHFRFLNGFIWCSHTSITHDPALKLTLFVFTETFLCGRCSKQVEEVPAEQISQCAKLVINLEDSDPPHHSVTHWKMNMSQFVE